MASDFLILARDLPSKAMRHRPVAIRDCAWQVRLQRKGNPLREYIEHRMLCLLEPSSPVVGVVVSLSGWGITIEKEFRRQDVIRQGSLVALTLAFPAEAHSFLSLKPASKHSWEEMRLCPSSLWRTAEPHERPDRARVSVNAEAEVLTGIVVEVATIAPDTRLAMLLVDVDDVKGLRAGRWRLRRAAAIHDSVWQILATGARTQHLTTTSW